MKMTLKSLLLQQSTDLEMVALKKAISQMQGMLSAYQTPNNRDKIHALIRKVNDAFIKLKWAHELQRELELGATRRERSSNKDSIDLKIVALENAIAQMQRMVLTYKTPNNRDKIHTLIRKVNDAFIKIKRALI